MKNIILCSFFIITIISPDINGASENPHTCEITVKHLEALAERLESINKGRKKLIRNGIVRPSIFFLGTTVTTGLLAYSMTHSAAIAKFTGPAAGAISSGLLHKHQYQNYWSTSAELSAANDYQTPETFLRHITAKDVPPCTDKQCPLIPQDHRIWVSAAAINRIMPDTESQTNILLCLRGIKNPHPHFIPFIDTL